MINTIVKPEKKSPIAMITKLLGKKLLGPTRILARPQSKKPKFINLVDSMNFEI